MGLHGELGLAIAQKWIGMGGLLQLFKDYDATLLMGGEIIIHL